MNSKLLLGDQLIDMQHDQLFELLKRVTPLHESGLNEEKVVDQLTRLNQHIHQHFRSEEALMLRLGMPTDELTKHQLEHLRILEEMAQLHLNIMHGSSSRVSDVFEQISGWITKHVLDFDLNMRGYISMLADK